MPRATAANAKKPKTTAPPKTRAQELRERDDLEPFGTWQDEDGYTVEVLTAKHGSHFYILVGSSDCDTNVTDYDNAGYDDNEIVPFARHDDRKYQWFAKKWAKLLKGKEDEYIMYGTNVLRIGARPLIERLVTWVEDARQRRQKDEAGAAVKLLRTIPGLAEVRTALTQYWKDADAEDAAIEWMMKDERNDGACPPASRQRVTDDDLMRLERQYPAAYLYSRAERRQKLGLSREPGDDDVMSVLARGGGLEEATAAKAKAEKEASDRFHNWD